MSEFAAALEAATDGTSKAALELTLLRDRQAKDVRIPSFPDTHASPLMGMGYTAAAAFRHEPSFRGLMAANR